MRRLLPILQDSRPRFSPSRRELVQWAAAAAAARALPACSSSSGTTPMPMPMPKPPAPVLSTTQADALAALADFVIPPDHQPGGAELGVVTYVENLLSALDGKTPKIFAGGPYSGRQPFASSDGTVSKNFPADSFKDFLPLDRYREAAWKLRLYGSDSPEVPGGGINDKVLGKTVGLRTQVPDLLDKAIAAIKVPLDTKTPASEVAKAFNALSTTDQGTLTELVIEGCFSTPEYGGNAKLAGFDICHFEGDSQPLGYSLYDETTKTYNELPNAPVSKPNPGPDPDPIDAETQDLLKTLVMFAGGKVFF